MKLVEFVPPTPHPLWELCPQMGITDVVVKVNPDLTGLPDPWRYDTLASIVSRLNSAAAKKTSDLGHRTSSAEVVSPKSEVLKLTSDQVWANYEYFIKAVMPTAEKWGVRMALHPDDPCIDSLGGYFTLGRLFANGYLKALLKGTGA